MVARFAVRLGGVEDGAEDGESQTTTVLRRRRDRCAKVLAHLGDEHGHIRRLVYEVDKQVVCRNEFCALIVSPVSSPINTRPLVS